MVDNRRSKDLPNKDEWRTPYSVFKKIEKALAWRFTLDPCTTDDNPLRTRTFYTKDRDGLSMPWGSNHVFVNPPFSQKKKWIAKIIFEANRDAKIALLLEAQTDSELFHYTIVPHAHVYLLRPRLRFENEKGKAVGDPMRGHILAVFGADARPSIECLDLKAVGVRKLDQVKDHAEE